MKKFWKKFVKDEEGAILVEYGMLIVIVALGMVVTLGTFQSSLATFFASIGSAISGSAPTSIP